LYSLFEENEIDLDALLLLKEEDLVNLGIKLGNRRKVQKFIHHSVIIFHFLINNS